jgi:hypothetical protein
MAITRSAPTSKSVATANALAMPCTRTSCPLASPNGAAPRLAAPNTVTRTASPSAPPTCCVTFTMLEAAPESSGRTPASAVVVSGTNASPIPAPNKIIGPATPGR